MTDSPSNRPLPQYEQVALARRERENRESRRDFGIAFAAAGTVELAGQLLARVIGAPPPGAWLFWVSGIAGALIMMALIVRRKRRGEDDD